VVDLVSIRTSRTMRTVSNSEQRTATEQRTVEHILNEALT